MKRQLIITFLLLLCSQLYGQNTVDTIAISFKAKLFTVSEYGLADKQTILKDIEGQKLVFLKTKLENVVFMKISFSQPYRIKLNTTTTLVRNCSYYLAFNSSTSRFYRIGGFNNLDIDDFFNDILLLEKNLFSIEGDDIEGIDLLCLYDYYKMTKRQRFKKGFTCMHDCNQKTKTMLREY